MRNIAEAQAFQLLAFEEDGCKVAWCIAYIYLQVGDCWWMKPNLF